MAFYCRWAPRSTRWHPRTHAVFPPTIKLSNWSLASHTVSLYVAIKKKSCMIRVIKKKYGDRVPEGHVSRYAHYGFFTIIIM